MTSKKINLDGSSHKQLIDLNGEAVNFNLEFVITPGQADKDKPYAISIITQDKLDSNADINLATIKGQFRKSLTSTSNNYQNLCLIINSDVKFTEPVQIDIELEDLGVPEPQQEQRSQRQAQAQMQEPAPTIKPEAESGNKKMKYIVGGLIIIVGACLLYYFWTQSKKKGASVIDTPTPVVASVEIPSIEEVSLPKASSDISKPTFSFY